MALTRPFAQNGDKLAIPETASDSSVSYNLGFTYAYALPPEEGGKFIDRAQFNQLMYDTTSAVISNQNSINTLNTKVANIESGVATGVVNLTTNQTIGGVKTFSAPPVSATNPSKNNQVANKAYVDSVGNAKVATTTYNADKATFATKTELNTKANANATVNLTGNQRIEGAKTFTSNITAPNITEMQKSINTINTSLSTVVSDSFTPYLILKSSAIGLKSFALNDGDGQDEIDRVIAEAAKYRMFRIDVNGTVTGNMSFSNINYGALVFDWETSAKLVGNLLAQSGSTIRVVRATIENGILNISRYSKLYMLSDVNITAPTGRSAIGIGSCSVIFTDQTTGYPPKPFNLTSDTYGIEIDNGSSFIAGRDLQINTTNTTTKISLSRGSFASLTGTTIRGDGNDFNIATNIVTANGIIMR